MISTHYAEMCPVFENACPACGAKSGWASTFESDPAGAKVAGTAESTSQRPATFRIAMLTETAPSGAPFRRWSSSTMSARFLATRSTVHPWKLVRMTGKGVTGRVPCAQLARSLPRRIVAVANGHAPLGVAAADRCRNEGVQRSVDRSPIGRRQRRFRARRRSTPRERGAGAAFGARSGRAARRDRGALTAAAGRAGRPRS
jgi:hypothetical protein